MRRVCVVNTTSILVLWARLVRVGLRISVCSVLVSGALFGLWATWHGTLWVLSAVCVVVTMSSPLVFLLFLMSMNILCSTVVLVVSVVLWCRVWLVLCRIGVSYCCV